MKPKSTRQAATLMGAVLAASMATLAHAGGYAFKALAPFGSNTNSYGETLNAQGLVLGDTYVSRTCPLSQWVGCLVDGYTRLQPRGVWWPPQETTAKPLVCLGTALAPSATWDKPCEALDVNGRGVMVGRSYVGRDATESQQRPVMWPSPGSAPTDLTPQLQGLPAYVSARAVAINEQGWILGQAQAATPASAQADGSPGTYVFLLRDGLASPLAAPSAWSVKARALNATMAVGEGRYDKGGQTGVVIWALGSVTTTLRTIDGTDNYVHAEALSSAGHVAGFYWAPASGQGNRAYIWYQGRVQALPTDAGHSSVAYGVNASGQVAGSHCRTDRDIHGCRAVVWTNGVRQDLNTLALAPAGFTFVQAKAINDQGQITGWMVNEHNAYWGFVLTPRP